MYGLVDEDFDNMDLEGIKHLGKAHWPSIVRISHRNMQVIKS